MDESKHVKIVIRGFDTKIRQFRSRLYEIKERKFASVLDALIHIKEKRDATVSFRYSCRMGICGSCAMVINGKPRLACETNVFKELESRDSIVVAPMEGHPILKDLVNDFDDFFEDHKSVKPWLFRKDKKEKFAAKKEYKQSEKERDGFLTFSECIKCGLCYDACPVVNTNRDFIGPQALSQAYRYYKDSRDQAGQSRLIEVDSLKGAWGCEFSGSCSKVCPKGVDPALAIQSLKFEIIKNGFLGKLNKPEQRIKKK
jgi:succinate dehydrogenase / fumarate reductase iron-sulfur subunit